MPQRLPARVNRRPGLWWGALVVVLAGCTAEPTSTSTTLPVTTTVPPATTAAPPVTVASTTSTTTTPSTTTTTTTTTTTSTTSTTTTTTTAPTTTTTVAPPAAPSGVTVSGPPCGGSGEVCVEWDVPADDTVTSYEIHRAEPGRPAALLATVTVEDLHAFDGRYQFIDDLVARPPADTDPWPLCYSVVAVAGTVTGPSSVSACTTAPLAVPTGVTATGPPCGGSEEVCVRWDVHDDPGVYSYVIYRGEQGSVDGYLVEVLVTDLVMADGRYQFVDSLVEHPPAGGDPYPLCYAVAAADLSGQRASELSEPACTTPG